MLPGYRFSRFFMMVFVSLMIGLQGPGLFAAEEDTQDAPPASTTEAESTGDESMIAEPTEVRSDYAVGVNSSAAARNTKMGGVGLRAGMMVSIATGLGLDGWWQATPDLQVGLLFGNGSVDLKDSVDEVGSVYVQVTKADVTASMAVLQARYFLGNSFVLTGGLGQREVKLDGGSEDTSNGDWARVKVDVTSTVLYLALGNVWTWDSGFFFGADWLSATVPLSSSVDSDKKTSISINSDLREQKDNLEKAGEDLGESSLFQLAVLNVGYTF